MKTIGKLSINPEKVIKNEELMNLKGGTTFRCCCGMGGGNANCFDVEASSCAEANWALTYVCSFGGGCFC